MIPEFVGVRLLGRGKHFPEIHAGAERRSGPGQHDRPGTFLLMYITECLEQLAEQLPRERVAFVGPIQSDRTGVLVNLNLDEWFGHR